MAAKAQERLVIENRLAELGRVEAWLAEISARWAIPPRAAFAVDLVINEALANVVSHAYEDDTKHEIELSLTDMPGAVIVEIVDDGEPFNPFDTPPVVMALDLEHAAIGGRGIHLIKIYADEHHYNYVAGRNRLKLVIHKAA